jgi:hypothetical protein
LTFASTVQYLRYARFLRISRTAKYAAFFEIAQALILNFLRHHLKTDFLRVCQYFTGIAKWIADIEARGLPGRKLYDLVQSTLKDAKISKKNRIYKLIK